MKIYTNELGHMTNMAAMPVYVKNLKKSSSPEPLDRWLWNLVCSIAYASTTKVVQIMTLGWPWRSWVSIKGQGHSLTLVKGHSDFKVKTYFWQKQMGNLESKLIWKLKGE